MKLMKLQLLIIVLAVLAANSVFAALSYDVLVDTSSLNNLDGYLYFQYLPVSAVDSTVTVSSFTTNGFLAPSSSPNVANGDAVNGQLPGNVVFANTNGINDYNHGIHFGNSIKFSLLFASNNFDSQSAGNSTFSLGFFGGEDGSNPLLNQSDPNDFGTLFKIRLNNDGTSTVATLTNEASVIPTPIPATAWLLISGLIGFVSIRWRKKA